MSRILILRFSSIGDIVLTTPVIRCLKQQIPGAEIHYLTKPHFAGILQHNPYIDKLHVLDKPLLQKARELRAIGFDHVIDLHGNLRTLILKAAIDVPAFTFDKLNLEKWLLVNMKLNVMPPEHIVDRYMAAVAPLGVKNDGKGLDYFLPANIETDIPEAFHNIRYTAVVIGAKHHTKQLPTEKLIEICQRIGGKMILLGASEDADRGKQIADAVGKNVFSACGVLKLHHSAYLLSKADRVLTHDTGLMHIAAAFHKPIVSVWGNTVPEFGMTPYYGDNKVRSSIAEIHELYCRPCSKIGFARCPLGHFRCMNEQDAEGIAATINS